jgi:hypothetical protein
MLKTRAAPRVPCRCASPTICTNSAMTCARCAPTDWSNGRGTHYAYRLTDKGVKVAVLFVLFHQLRCGPLAHSLFRHQPQGTQLPNTNWKWPFHKADDSIREIRELLEAALKFLTTLLNSERVRS